MGWLVLAAAQYPLLAAAVCSPGHIVEGKGLVGACQQPLCLVCGGTAPRPLVCDEPGLIEPQPASKAVCQDLLGLGAARHPGLNHTCSELQACQTLLPLHNTGVVKSHLVTP